MMFFIELMASRFDIFGEQDLEAADPALDLIRRRSTISGKVSEQKASYQNGKSVFFADTPLLVFVIYLETGLSKNSNATRFTL
jgi:hypothetical protein